MKEITPARLLSMRRDDVWSLSHPQLARIVWKIVEEKRKPREELKRVDPEQLPPEFNWIEYDIAEIVCPYCRKELTIDLYDPVECCSKLFLLKQTHWIQEMEKEACIPTGSLDCDHRWQLTSSTPPAFKCVKCQKEV